MAGDDRRIATPVEGVPIPVEVILDRVERLDQKVSAIKSTVVDHDRLLVELSGRSGQDGRLGGLTRDLRQLSGEVSALSDRLHSIRIKLAVAVAVAAGTGAAGANAVLRLLGGGG